MVWFTGTSTGNKYTVGGIYQRNGEKYRANVDGSFTKLSTGKVSVGSSQSKKVQWGGFSSSPARSSSGRPSPTQGVGAAAVVQAAAAASPPRPLDPRVVGGGVVDAVPVVLGSGGGGVLTVPAKTFFPEYAPLEVIGGGYAQESAGAIADYGWARTMSGFQLVPSEQVKERMDDDFIQSASWAWRNFIAPNITGQKYPLPPGVTQGPFETWSMDMLGHATPRQHYSSGAGYSNPSRGGGW